MLRKLLFAIPLCLFAFEGQEFYDTPVKPWFTGPLLASSGNIVPLGHINVQPYVLAIARSAFYDNQWKRQSIDTLWNVRFFSPFWFGIAPWADIKVSPSWQWNERNGQDQWVFCDSSAQIDIQLRADKHENWLPAMKVVIREVFPTGPYQNLNPKKFGTDAGGEGCYRTWFAWCASKSIEVRDNRFLQLYFNLAYSLATKVHVKGFNAYGGGYKTDGTISPEEIAMAIFSMEYSLSQRWAVACDAQAVFSGKIGFSGKPGMAPNEDGDIEPLGIAAVNQRQASIQYLLAPALEYSWSSNLGMIAGAYFTLAGKNSSYFRSAAISLCYYH